VAGRTPLDKPRQKNAGNNYTAVDMRQLPASSAAPYTDTQPVTKPPNRTRPPATGQPKAVVPKPSNDLELTSRPTNKPPATTARTKPSAPPQVAPKPGGRSGQRRNNNDLQNDEQMSSQF
jgi:hypothetical protein